jgi:spore coat protein A, manganese oxidase
MTKPQMTDRTPQAPPGGTRFGRRALLTAGGAGALALLLPVRSGSHKALLSLADSVSKASSRVRFPAPLRIPKVLTGSDIDITIKPARVQVLPGRKTKMWTYGGTFPGPTIRRPAGQATRVTFHHRLPRAAGELTVHLHGGHNRSRFDGQPGGLTRSQKIFYCQVPSDLSAKASGNDLLISPGHSKTYLYDLVEDGGPERAAFQWYHDHRLERTGRNVWKGLAGMFILDDDFEANNGLNFPSGSHDVPLLIADRTLNGRHQLSNPFKRHLLPPNDGIKGKYVLVNGVWRPHFNVAARRYRLRLLNAANFRAYNLSPSGGVPMVQIASDSGLMPKAVRRRAVLLAPAERAEVIVDFTDYAGKSVILRSVKRTDGVHAPGTTPFIGPVMQFRVGSAQSDSSLMPSDGQDLRPLPDWVASLPGGLTPRPDKAWKITIGGGLNPRWLINGRTFNPAHVEHQVTLGSTEVWKIHNKTSMAHVFHIHSTDWYLLSRNGHRPPPWEDCLKESFFMKPNETIYIAGHFADSFATGKYVVHCHMLDHEDHGLMSQFKVVT